MNTFDVVCIDDTDGSRDVVATRDNVEDAQFFADNHNRHAPDGCRYVVEPRPMPATKPIRRADALHHIAILRVDRARLLDAFHAGDIDADELDQLTDEANDAIMTIQDQLASVSAPVALDDSSDVFVAEIDTTTSAVDYLD